MEYKKGATGKSTANKQKSKPRKAIKLVILGASGAVGK
jgi:hypothetical protein